MDDDASAERAEEQSALESILQDDFKVISESEWLLLLAEGRAQLRLQIPCDYPRASPPIPMLETIDGHAAFSREQASTITEQLISSFTPGEICCFEWRQLADEAVSAVLPPSDREVAHGGDGGGIGGSDSAVANAAECSLPIPAELADPLCASFLAAGFTACGPGVFAHSGRGLTVEVHESLTICVDGIDADDLGDWATLQLQEVETFGAHLLEWTAAQRSAEPGFSDDSAAADGPQGLDFLPSPEALHVNKEREVAILTWGKALRKSAPAESQFNFNAGVLNGRGGGADLRTMNGLSDEVQNNVSCCGLFPRWLEMVTSKIEGADLQVVSVNCTKGRHRSVAAAEILKKIYYPKATIRHLTIT
eukprot:TRINITY_DN25056_c0_g1_i1.p1 TRINITY_DN25056_c0_g1~~TRINITY_DN25056_c0_g1_i1.p1  ORF type:complete len:384 (-),score=73.58 TRINITY_DN25056_c0_g1_i1:58-1149(-)